MRTNSTLRILFCALLLTLSFIGFSQATNNSCGTAVGLTPNQGCTAASSATGNLQKANSAAPAGGCGGATGSTTYDVWYKFTATKTSTTITISNYNSLDPAQTFVELLSGVACAGFTSLKCQSISTPLSFNTLTVGAQYYVRVYNTVQVTSNPSKQWDFDICIQDPPTNDDCNGSI